MTSERKGCLKGLVMVCAGILALSVGFVKTGEATSYTFVKIADSQDRYNQFGFSPSLTNEGTVAFSATLDGLAGSGIFMGNGGPVVTVVETGTEYSDFSRPSIGSGDRVASRALLKPKGMVVLRGDGATLTTIADTKPGSGFSSLGEVSINNSGRVAFQGTSNLPGIFVSDGQTLTTIATTIPGSLSSFGIPAIADTGTVVFRAFDASGWGIFKGSGGSVVALAKGDDFSSFLDPSISDMGIAAFRGFLRSGGEGVFKHDGAGLTVVADTSGAFRLFSFASVNDEGVVAFKAFPRAGGSGIFTGPDPEKDKVIAVGDVLLGLKVIVVNIGWEGLNNAGQVAFHAQLADGTTGIYRADPVPDEVSVTVDVKPGDNPNVINRDSNGVVPVAILSTESFDARSVDPTTIKLANAPIKMKKNGTPMVAFEDVNGDGREDLMFHVSTPDLQLEESDSEVVLEGQTLDGTPVRGTDSVRVIH